MKKILVNTLTICYTETGSGRNTIVLLHGWGQSHTFWTDFEKNVGKKYHIYSLDLPGFGVSQEPPAIWDITDYASFLHQFITQIGIVKPTIVGHSFGGRIAIAYASTYPVHKLILYSNGGLPAYSLMKFFYKKLS